MEPNACSGLPTHFEIFILHSEPDTNGEQDHKYENDCVYSLTPRRPLEHPEAYKESVSILEHRIPLKSPISLFIA